MKLIGKVVVLLLILQFSSLINSQASTTGCDVISSIDICYSYFSSASLSWSTAEVRCKEWGGHLATLPSYEENILMYSAGSGTCWIGFNDIVVDNTWVWADGSTSTYKHWYSRQPSNGRNEDCAVIHTNKYWYDESCTRATNCYFCSTTLNPFGEKISEDTYAALKDNSFLYKDTTLYCITENKNTPKVTWTFKDLYGVATILYAETDATTGVSTLFVSKDKPGFYSCDLTQNLGIVRQYTAVMLDDDRGSPVLTVDYGCGNTFLLLPPAVNRADIPILTQNVILSTNLVGRWQTPDDSYVNSDSITIQTLYVSDAGLYKFYVTNLDGNWTLTIQIYLTPVGSSFGKQLNPNTLVTLSEDSVLISNTILYCLTDSNITDVVWIYEDVSGNMSNISGTTDANTGISTLYVTTDVPGYYSCEVSLEEGIKKTFTVEMIDVSQFTAAVNTESYQYTLGVDTEDLFLFCQSVDESYLLSDIHWRRQDRIGFFTNPLDVHRLGYLLKYTNSQPMECFNRESADTIMNVNLNVQGPPIITLYNTSKTDFSFLPPAVNRADIPILTQNIILSANLVGRWQTPDDSYINSDSITIQTLYVSDEGLYKFYVTNWDGDWALAIQIYISPIETYTQTIIDLRAETASEDSILVVWSLSERDLNSFGTFSVYFGFGNFEVFAGTTKYLFYELKGLVPNGNYTFRVELKYPNSALTISATTHHFLSMSEAITNPNNPTNPTIVAQLNSRSTAHTQSTNSTTTEIPTNTKPSVSYTMYTFIAVLIIFISTLIILLFLCVFIVCVMRKRKRSKGNSRNSQVQLPQVQVNEIYQQVDSFNSVEYPNKAFVCKESVEVYKQTGTEMDQKVPIPADTDSMSNHYSIDD